MVHSAYDSFQLVANSSARIDAVELYGSTLLLSCSDGSLRIYGPESSAGEDRFAPSTVSELKKEPYVLERTINGFSKKPMLAMEIIKSRELLLSLSESITFHRLPNFEILAVITKAKGANAYSWDEKRGFLCFARYKRVFIFRHDGARGFVEVKEYGVPDNVKSMSWCGENICLGIRREYVILNSTNGALSEVFPSGRTAPPLVVSLPSGELLLGKDNIGVFVDQNGKLLQEGRICWSEAPASVVIEMPYAVGLLPRHIEIRSLRDPYPLIQTVVLRNARRLLQITHAMIVALENSVYGFFPVPLGAQIVQLTASGNFEEALALCKLLPPEDSSLRAAKEQSIHIRYAHHLFENGSYEEAMDHFLASQVEITYVLSLYPSIVLPKSSAIPEPEKYMDISEDAPDLSRRSSAMSDYMESSFHPHELDSDESADLQSKKMSHNTLMALIKFLQRKRFSIVEKAAAEGTEEAVSDAVGNSFVSYGYNRPKKPIKGRANVSISSVAREIAAILDTALLQALLLTGQPSAALELLRGLNYCNIKICEEFLQERNQHVCLLELYKCNAMHREALNLLHKLVEESNSDNPPAELTQKFKPEMIIEYLKVGIFTIMMLYVARMEIHVTGMNLKVFPSISRIYSNASALSYIMDNYEIYLETKDTGKSRWKDSVQEVKEGVKNYFTRHFSQQEWNRPRSKDIVFDKLIDNENAILTAPFSEAEIKNAVWNCDSSKSPGPDEFNFRFVKAFWHLLKDDFIKFFEEFHKNGKLVKGRNLTFLVLIPKKDNPNRPGEFRPIALIGCIYKVLSKVLANRLRMILDRIIYSAQSAFIGRRHILEGVLIANETIDELKRQKKEAFIFKVDFEKAYDSVNWNFVDQVMMSMNFDAQWRKWIIECVLTARASVLVNGSPTMELNYREA